MLILAPECYQPLRAVGAAFHASEDGVEAVRRVADLLAVPAPAPGSAVPSRGELRVSSLRVARRGGFAPDGETFTVRPGETVWLRAPSGGGKSTTLSALLGFVPAHDGAITIGTTNLADADLARWREQVAWVPQSPVFTGGTVREELGSDDLLAELGLDGLADRPVAHLSLGQRQRVAVARALRRVRDGAWLLLLDEPTAHLDEASARLVLDAVQRAVDGGAAAIIAAHERTAAVDLPPGAVAVSDESTVDSSRPPLAWRALFDGRLFGGAVLGAVALLAGVALTATSGWLIAKASQQPPILTLTVAVVGVRAFGLGRAGLRYAERLVTHDAAFRIAGRLRVRLWDSLVRLGPARSLRAGEGQRRLEADVDTVRDLLPRVVSPPLVVALVVAGAIAVQTWVLPAAGLALAAAVAVGLCAPWVALRAERRATSALARGRREVASRVLVLFEAAAELLAFGTDRPHRRALTDADTRLAAQARHQAFGAGAAEALVTLACGAAAVVSTALAAAAVTNGQLDPVLAPLLALVPLALAEVLALLPPVAQHWDTLQRARHRLADTPDESVVLRGAGLGGPGGAVPPQGVDLGEAAALVVLRGAGLGGSGGAMASQSVGLREAAAPVLRGADLDGPGGAMALHGVGLPEAAAPVVLRGADLGWPGGPTVLHDVDLELAPGTYAAVVGPSGAGKSTLVAALLGFLAPRRGVVAVPDGVAWAPQEPMLAATTVAENLRLARPTATPDELREALRLAELGDVDLSTLLGSGGSGLSGGQAQRVALARALLGAPSAGLVLLDEPTAHLDEPTAHAVRAHLREALAGRTVVHVTHRAEEAAGADVVFEVRDGRVAARVPVA